MDKKRAFQTIIADFIGRPLSATLPRQIDVPVDVPKIVSLLGPRRAGKTQLLFHIINQLRQTVQADRLVYVNFEDDRIFPLALTDMESLLQGYYELYPGNRDTQVWFFFDEIQEVPDWEKFIRRLADTEDCRIYLTGSSSKMLSRELATALRGRTLPIEVFPLSFPEFLSFNTVDVNARTSKGRSTALHWFDRWLRQGGFPELVFLPENLHTPTINEYLDLMLYRDLTERFAVKNPTLLKYLLKYTLSNLANPLSTNKVYNDLKSQGYAVSKNTVYDYLDHLEEAFVLFHTDIWHRSARARAVNPSKYYTIDPAFKYATNIGSDTGRVLENAVYLHLRRHGLAPHYYLDDFEVDFFWENGEPVNVCLGFYDAGTRERELRGMIAALVQLGLSAGRIITRDIEEEIHLDGKTIRVQPAWQYFSEGI